MIAFVVVVYLILAIYEFVPLYKQKQWREFGVNSVLGVFSFTIALLLCLGIEIPSPAPFIQGFITSIFGK